MSGPVPDSFRCHWCLGTFDPLQTAWCQCIALEHSPVCPSCLRCSCSAPRSFRSTLWRTASLPVAEARQREKLSLSRVPADLSIEEVRRPLALIAEHDPPALGAAVRVLTALGFGTVTATGGRIALEKAQAFRPEVVLTRALLSGLDGRVLCSRLKESPSTASVRTIVMTSIYKNARYRYEAQAEFQVDEYLVKPVELAALRDALRRLGF